MPRPRLALIASLVAAFAFSCSSGSAGAAVTVDAIPLKAYPSDSEGRYLDLRIVGDGADDQVALSLTGQLLVVNDEQPASTPIDFSRIMRLRISGGPGNDTIDLRGLRDFGGFVNSGSRTIPGTNFAESGLSILVRGDAGDDRIEGLGSSAADVAAAEGRGFGHAAADMRGGEGDDLVSGSRYFDVLSGGAGDDRLFGWDGTDDLQGGPGADRVSGGDNGAKPRLEEIFGGSGDDVLYGGGGDDLMLGKQGNDELHGGPGRDTMYQNTQSRRGYGPNGGCEGAPPGLCNPIVN